MTPEDKIEFVKLKIIQKSLTTKNKSFIIKIEDETEQEVGSLPSSEDPIVLKKEEQLDIIKKLKLDGFLSFFLADENIDNVLVVLDDTNPEELLLKSGKLSINKNTGLIQLNKVINILNPKSDEFHIIYTLFRNKNNQATYQELLGDKINNIANKQSLACSVRDVKRALGILPADKSKNIDIIENIKKIGYRLIK